MDRSRTEELEAHYRKWEDQELARAVIRHADLYVPEALALIQAEVERRGLSADELQLLARKGGGDRRSGNPLEGVKGWLGFLVLWILVHSGSQILTGVVSLSEADSPVLWVIGLFLVAIGFSGLVICWYLLRLARFAPRITAIWLMASAGWMLALVFLGVHLPVSFFWPAESTWTSLLWYGTWFVYLHRSNRVQATYGTRLAPEEVIATFS